MNANRRRLQENIAALGMLQLLGYVAPLLTVPYLVRVLKPHEFGLLSFAQGIVLYFDLLTDFGFNFSATRAIAAKQDDSFSVSRIFWSTLFAKLFLMIGSGVVLALLVVTVPRLRAAPGLYAASFPYVIGTAIFPVWLFQGLERMKIAAIALGAARALTIPALFLYVKQEHDYVIAAAIQASVQVSATLFIIPALRELGLRWYRPRATDLAETFRGGWPLFTSGSALYVCTSSTTVVLGFAAGGSVVGYYSAAEKVVRAAGSLLSPITQAMYPHIAAVRTLSFLSAVQLIRKSLFSTGAISLCASVGIFAFAGPICHATLGPAFDRSVTVLRWLSPLPLLFGLMSVFGTQTMLIFGMDSMMSRIMVAGAAFGIPLTLALSRLFGAEGAAAASALVSLAMVIAMIAVLRFHGLAIWQFRKTRLPPC